MISIKDYEHNEIVKSLREKGLDDEYIVANIENGNIKVEKACKKKVEKAEEDFEEEHDFSEHKDKDGKEMVSDKKKRKYHDKDEKKEDEFEEKEEFDKGCMKKSLDNDFEKSFMESPLGARFEQLEKSINSVAVILQSMQKQAPSFKGANLNGSVLEKSVNIEKSQDGKYPISLTTQREAVRNIIAKSVELEKDETVKHHIVSESKNFMMAPDCNELSKSVIDYLGRKGFSVVK